MDLERLLYKAEHLLKQQQYGEAQKEVSAYLASEPESIPALILLARVYLGMGKDEKADEITDHLVRRDPSDPNILYLKAVTQASLGKRKNALKFADSALAYYPMFTSAHALKATIFFQQADFEKALEAAISGLSNDPDDDTCLNYRSMSLLRLDREEEHVNADQQALKSNPMNPTTHATVGFNALQKGELDKAKSHFREALRIDPTNELARMGTMQAIKSTNIFYRLFLKYVFWMSGLKPQVRWAVIIIGYILINALSRYSSSLGSFSPVASVIIGVYMIFAISTWIMHPVSNIFLRFHAFGKYMLTSEEMRVANISAALLSVAFLGAIGLLIFGDNAIRWHNLSLYLLCTGVALTVVVSSISNRILEKSERRLRKLGVIYAIACGLLILLAIGLPGLALKFFDWCLYGFIAYQFYANSQE